MRIISRKDPTSIPTVLPEGFSIVGVAQTAAAIFDSLFEESVRDVVLEKLLVLVKLWMNYAMLWAYGGMISTDLECAPQRDAFSRWWRESTGVDFGDEGVVWDYVVETTKVTNNLRCSMVPAFLTVTFTVCRHKWSIYERSRNLLTTCHRTHYFLNPLWKLTNCVHSALLFHC